MLANLKCLQNNDSHINVMIEKIPHKPILCASYKLALHIPACYLQLRTANGATWFVANLWGHKLNDAYPGCTHDLQI